MKQKNGFTLIELLLVIALVVSLLGIAVFNVIKLTNKQKENSYESVKEQVITAAEQYFSSNEYLFEGISETGFGIIPVGELVKEDYLNKLTNPATGLALNSCDKVKAKRNLNGTFDFEFITDNTTLNCQFNGVEIHSDDKAPNLELKFLKASDNTSVSPNGNNWFKYYVDVKIKTDGIFMGVCTGDSASCPSEYGVFDLSGITVETMEDGYKDKTSYEKETNITEYTYKVCKNNTSSCTTNSIIAGVDTIAPEVSVDFVGNPDLNKWHKTNIKYIGKVQDTGSGLKTILRHWNKSKLSQSAANNSTNKWNGTKYLTGNNSNVLVNEGETSLVTDENTFTNDGYRKITYSACDVAGNCNNDENYVKMDNTPPTLTLSLVSKKSSTWYNKDISYKVTTQDTLSGIDSMTRHLNSAGLKTTQTTTSTNKWDGVKYPTGSQKNISINKGATTIITESSFVSDEGHRKITYVVCDQAKNCIFKEVDAKLDKTKPTCVVSISPNKSEDYVHKTAPSLKFTGADALSGIKNGNKEVFTLTRSASIKSGTNQYKEVFTDLAGNESSCNRTVVYDDADPTCPSTLLTYTDVTSGKNSYCNTSKSTGSWHCASVKATLNKGSNWVKYKWDGVETTSTTKTYSSSGTYKPTITAYDAQGDSITCTAAEFKIDKSQPNVNLSLTVTEDGYAVAMENKWYNKNVDYKAIVSDSYSGVNTIHKYWNKSGLNSDNAKSTTYSWNSTKGEYKNGGNASVSVTKGATSVTTPASYLSAEGHRKIRYTVCDQAGNCNSAAKDAMIDKTPPTTPTISYTPTICQVYGSGYTTYTQTNNKVSQIITASTFNTSSCTNSFTYTSGKFNGKLVQAKPGSYVLYAEYKSSDALSGLEKITGKSDYTNTGGWKFVDNYYAYGETTPSTLCSAEKGENVKGGYPCKVTRSVTVTDRAGNVSASATATYNNLSY